MYGPYSWILIALAAGLTGCLVLKLLNAGGSVRAFLPSGKAGTASRIIMGLLLMAVSGGMTAAAGELAALTVPLVHARVWGGVATLIFCTAMSGKSLRGLAGMGKLLLPVMAAAFLLCLRLPEAETQLDKMSVFPVFTAVLRAVGYCGMNVLLAAEVVCEAGRDENTAERRRTALGAGLLLGMVLALGNGALLRHNDIAVGAPLPVVALLRAYGKAGFYLAAAVLYLAVVTTLLASLRGLCALLLPHFPSRAKTLSALAAAAVSLMGFENIVAGAYPALGWLSLLLIFLPAFHRRN